MAVNGMPYNCEYSHRLNIKNLGHSFAQFHVQHSSFKSTHEYTVFGGFKTAQCAISDILIRHVGEWTKIKIVFVQVYCQRLKSFSQFIDDD